MNLINNFVFIIERETNFILHLDYRENFAGYCATYGISLHRRKVFKVLLIKRKWFEKWTREMNLCPRKSCVYIYVRVAFRPKRIIQPWPAFHMPTLLENVLRIFANNPLTIIFALMRFPIQSFSFALHQQSRQWFLLSIYFD